MSRLSIVLLGAVCVMATLASATAAADWSVIPAYLTKTAPTIDGEIKPGEWDAVPPTIVLADPARANQYDGMADLDPYGGAADLSFKMRVMWQEPWMVYALVEVTDDIAMETDPTNLWERDQVELFMDGDDHYGRGGSDADHQTFQWWDAAVPVEEREFFGKFGVSRWGAFEGNGGAMSEFIEDLYYDEFGFKNVAAAAAETGNNGDYFVEYAISLEPMFERGTFDDDPITSAAGKVVVDHTTMKMQVAMSDDDNFSNGTTERSHGLSWQAGLRDWRDTANFANLTFLGEYKPGVNGDYSGNGTLDAADLDLQAGAMVAGGPKDPFDLNGDNAVNFTDRKMWLHDLKKTWVGDSDLNGQFTSDDFVLAFQAGKYEVPAAPATWIQGDWNGDQLFTSDDFVAAFADGGYEAGPRPGAVSAVPEPSAAVLLALGLLGLGRFRRR